MNVVRYEPVNVFRQFSDEASRFFPDGEAKVRVAGPGAGKAPSTPHPWALAVDVKEEDERYVITADVPGVEPKDIEITAEDGVLSIKGSRSGVVREQSESYARIERSHGEFERRFNLPEGADADGIAASSNHGVLSVSIPKSPASKPRRIEIQ